MWPRNITNFFIIKPNGCINFTNSFCHETLHVSDSSSVHHQEFIHSTLNKGICRTAFEQDQDGTAVPSRSCSKAVYKPVWHIPLLSVQWINSWWWTEELSETCRVSWQNKFVKLVHLVGCITKKFDEYVSHFITFYVPVNYWLFISEFQVPKLELHFAFDVSHSFVVLHGSTTASCALGEESVCDWK